MFLHTRLSLLLLPLISRFVSAYSVARSSSSCNNSPDLCDRSYDKVTYLGAHDSPFLRDSSTGYTVSGNQFYNSTVQLSAGVRLLTAQIWHHHGELHVCHSSCELLDAGPLSTWLAEVRSWMESNPNNVVTILLVNGPSASAKSIAKQYEAAGITSDLTYTPSGTQSGPPGGVSAAPAESSAAATGNGQWPTLQSMIDSGKRLVNFVDYIGDTADAPFLLHEFDYIFENPYEVTAYDGFVCGVNRPHKWNGSTSRVIAEGIMPLMNHFLYQNDGLGIQSPNEDKINTTNSPNKSLFGSLGHSAAQCSNEYGRAPTYLLVDFFNVGPAITVADRLNGISNTVGRTFVSRQVLSSAASASIPRASTLWIAGLAMLMCIYG